VLAAGTLLARVSHARMPSPSPKPRTFELAPLVLASALLHVIGFASLAQIRFTRGGDSSASDFRDEEAPGFVLLDLRPTLVAQPEPELQAPAPAPAPLEMDLSPSPEPCAEAREVEPEPSPEPLCSPESPRAAPAQPALPVAGAAVRAFYALALWTAGTLAAAPAPAAAHPATSAPAASAAPVGAARAGPRPAPAARLLRSCEPRYPSRCIHLGIEGSVLCRMHVDTSGKVLEVEIVESSGHAELDREAQRALAQWRFEAPRLDGRALESRVLHRVTFRLRARR
jgi:protein TonB